MKKSVNSFMDKPKLLDNQSAHYFSLTSLDFEKSYKVMDMRIKRGFSDRDLSFLLGYHPLYVRDIENPLHKLRYKAKDTNYLRHIFNCELSDIMHGALPFLSYQISVITTINDNKTKTYQIYIEHKKKNKLFRTFTELDRGQRLLPKSIATPAEVKDFIKQLLNTGHFDSAKTGLELFREVTTHFNGHIKPTFIEEAIKDINKEHVGSKIKISKNEMSRWVYEKVELIS